MIPVRKLQELPPAPRLKKIARILEFFERSRSAPESVSLPDTAYLAAVADLAAATLEDWGPLEESGAMPGPAARRAAEALAGAATPDWGSMARAVNELRHLCYLRVGKTVADWDLVDHSGRIDGAGRRFHPGVSVYLDDIRSPYNLGSIFRSAEAFGVERVFLSRFCPSPEHPRAARTSMGCTEALHWDRVDLESLAGRPVFVLETGGKSLRDFPFPQEGVMIIGSEEFGASAEALALADRSLGRASIPTVGAKASLNVAVAFGIAMAAWAGALAAAD